ncbi:helix-turn-helix domain-containing protein [Anaerofustis stercorihominis]|uniref:helix-turn-helix domain-containing protein n=1 Tax=Anaerofustis stercorihominis TaxID=214853 RepID=UPI001106B380|nr:helix-turn-helix transcriptional regulator [Anaerofustis stercorihominis]
MNQSQIGKFIKSLREEKNLTQEQLAEKLNVSNKSVSRWENGKTMPDLSLLVMICEEFDITISELLNGRRMSIEELKELKDTVERLINYSMEEQSFKAKKVNRFLILGILFTILAILNNYIPYLDFIFRENIAQFVSGLFYGLGTSFELVGLYNSSNRISLKERKKALKKDK